MGFASPYGKLGPTIIPHVSRVVPIIPAAAQRSLVQSGHGIQCTGHRHRDISGLRDPGFRESMKSSYQYQMEYPP